MKMPYSTEISGEKTSKAFGKELDCSPKDSRNIARKIRGMNLQKAIDYLEEVKNLKKVVPRVYHLRSISHRKGKIGPGNYPVNAAVQIQKVLTGVKNNAEEKGLLLEACEIVHISAYPGKEVKGYMPRARGRSSSWNKKRTNVEIVVQEKE
jgi:large subunit ribosomal protein L22